MVGFVNVRGQQSLSPAKLHQLTDFIKQYSLNIVNLQETHISEDTFSDCEYITQNFDIIYNNAPSKFGTAVLVSTAIKYSNVKMDQSGHVIVYNLQELNITGANIYLQCGASTEAKNSREEYSARIMPQLLLERSQNTYIGGDWNNIVLKSDCTRHPDNKMSPALAKLIKTFQFSD